MLKTEIVIDDTMRSEIKKSPIEISQLIKDLENNEEVGMFLSILSNYYLSIDDVFCAWRNYLITDEQIYDFVKEIKKEITKANETEYVVKINGIVKIVPESSLRDVTELTLSYKGKIEILGRLIK